MGVADFTAGDARAFAGRFPGTLDETTVRGKILYPRKARDIVNFLEEYEAEDLADAGHRLEQIQGMGVMVLGGCDDAEFDVTQQFIIVGDEREIDFDTFLHCRISKTLGDPVTVGFVGDLFANGGQVILAIGILHMGEEFAAFAGQVHAAAQYVAGGAHLGGIHIGLREHATAQQHGDFVGVDLVVFRLAAMDSFHIEGMTQDEGIPWSAQRSASQYQVNIHSAARTI